MPKLHQYDYLFAIGTIFAFLDAWNIGANDVANSFATSVASRSLTMKQAMMIATCMEFTGSMTVGARVADTIRTKIISTGLFTKDPAVLMLAMVCAVVGSSIYLTIATKLSMPVSTTHSIMGGVIGAGIAAVGVHGINWGWNGVSQVFAAWAIAPGIAGAFGSIIFLITKFGVMRRSNPAKKAIMTVPVYFFLTSALLALLIVWKGGSAKIKLKDPEVAGVIVGTGGVVALLISVFFVPYLWRRIVAGDWQLKWYHVFQGPLLLRRGEVPPMPADHVGIQNYYRGHLTREELQAKRAREGHSDDVEAHPTDGPDEKNVSSSDVAAVPESTSKDLLFTPTSARPVGPWYNPAVAFWITKRVLLRGVEVDVVGMQSKRDFLSGDLEEMHATGEQFNNEAEYTFSFLQVLTAATSSFTHGANDVANAIGPYTTIYFIWSSGTLKNKVPVPDWILAFGGAAIVIGLWTYGYNIMKALGNKITLHSPSRGFSMELGSAITVIMATRLKLPISTTQCICGATVGVGLCNGTWRTINWRMVAWIYFGWIITLPVAGLISGCLMGIILNAPHWTPKK
ncbi:phosphate-repressible phosphate permease-like protein [Lindgomyces ingoldianus]|uniref:Phosphate-repressible phosphate permease-like protein n=1 Tax=Lindgomyces ingoldianus TaxID=673940 RepID=A0ACB6QLS4_9PLEO|nr:phosphate-repressible phosphate permease-like protein [Lindgomyces ingoldianus]KAF2467938.1 phosphate-repressible phosphate permease-like protein [Lindgomyces ingoldianus]